MTSGCGASTGFFANRVRSVRDAEDLTQRTFEWALRAWRRFDPKKGSLRTRLLAIARNVLVDHFRADDPSRHRPLEDVGEEQLGVFEDAPDLGTDQLCHLVEGVLGSE